MTVPEFVGAVRGYRKRMEHQWEHTRYLASVLININRDPKTAAVSPEELIPLSFDKKKENKPASIPMPERMQALAEKYKKK